MENTMPAIFFGHGNPMNALLSNGSTKAWSAIGTAIPKPRAVLAVSAHWYVPGTFVTAMAAPRTIHDFGGFPPELYQIEYSAPGDPELAGQVTELLAPFSVDSDHQWGLDHGTWAVRFEDKARKLLLDNDHLSLIDYETLGPDAMLSVPTPDHYLPLLFVIALQRKDEPVSFPVEGFDGGSISMLTVMIG